MIHPPLTLRHGLAAAVLLALCACKPPAPPQDMPHPPAPVTATFALKRDVPVYIDEIGRTAASELVSIQPQVTGQIMKRHFADGADIKTGDPLFDIDPRTYQAMVQQAQANLEQAQAQMELAIADYKRYQPAAKVHAVSAEDLDSKKAAVDTSTAQVKVTQAALDTAKLNLSYCNIASPIDGRAGQRLVDVGNIVKANETALLTIQRITPIYADFTIVEAQLPRVRNEMNAGTLQTVVSLNDAAHDDPAVPRVPGKLTFLDSNVQQGAGRILLRATLDNQNRYFWPGQFVYVRLVLSTIKDAVLLPFQCTQQGQQGTFVFVIKADTSVELRPIVIGQRQQLDGQDMVVVTSGLKPGEQVVQTGQLAIGPGAKVRVVEPPPATPAPGAATSPETAASAPAAAPASAPDGGPAK